MDLPFSQVTQHLKETFNCFLVHMKHAYLREKRLLMKFCNLFFGENKTKILSKYLRYKTGHEKFRRAEVCLSSAIY